MRKRSMLAALFTVLVVVFSAQSAQAHFLGYYAVDGNEIRYEDYTQWNDVA